MGSSSLGLCAQYFIFYQLMFCAHSSWPFYLLPSITPSTFKHFFFSPAAASLAIFLCTMQGSCLYLFPMQSTPHLCDNLFVWKFCTISSSSRFFISPFFSVLPLAAFPLTITAMSLWLYAMGSSIFFCSTCTKCCILLHHLLDVLMFLLGFAAM